MWDVVDGIDLNKLDPDQIWYEISFYYPGGK